MTCEKHLTQTPPRDWTPCEFFVLSLLGQQQALTLDQLMSFLRGYERTAGTSFAENLKNTSDTLVERLQRAGMVSVRQFDQFHTWISLTEEGMRSLEIPLESKALTQAILPTLHAINAIRLALSEHSPQGVWINREQLRREHAVQECSPLSYMPVAEFDTGEGATVAIFLLLRWKGSEAHLLTSIRQHLEREKGPGKPSYNALWYYASPKAALHLRRVFAQIAQTEEESVQRLRVLSYPLIPKATIYHGHHAPICHLAWSPDGKWMASTDEEPLLHVWCVQTGATLFTKILHDVPTTALAWSADGTRLALTNEDGVLSLWNVITGEHLALTIMHADAITGLAWAPGHHDRLATCAVDGSIQVFDLTHNRPLWKAAYGVDHRWSTLAWSPDGTRLAVGSTTTQVRLFAAATGQPLFTYKKHPHSISALAWSPDSTLVASASENQDVHIWKARSGKTVRRFWSTLGMVYRMDWSCDGKRFAWIGDTERVEVWDPQTGEKLFVYDDHATIVNALAWSPDGMLLASGGADQTVHVYRTAGGSQ